MWISCGNVGDLALCNLGSFTPTLPKVTVWTFVSIEIAGRGRTVFDVLGLTIFVISG